jgi:hypothetical protein
MADVNTSLTGTLRALLLFDVAEEIDLPALRSVLGLGPAKREPAFRHPAPEYVRFERPPVVECLAPCQTKDGKELLVSGCAPFAARHHRQANRIHSKFRFKAYIIAGSEGPGLRQ